MSKFAGIHVGLMALCNSDIDFRLTVTAQIVELNPFHVCTTHSQCSVIFSTELLFCKKQIFFQLIAMVPMSMCFSLDQNKVHVFTCGSIQDSSGSENFCYRSDSSPEGSLKFFRYWNPRTTYNGSSEMNSRQNEEGRPNQLSLTRARNTVVTNTQLEFVFERYVFI